MGKVSRFERTFHLFQYITSGSGGNVYFSKALNISFSEQEQNSTVMFAKQ